MTEGIGLIQGKQPDSANEWYVFLALDDLGHRFIYQFVVKGGRIRGGQVADFYVTTAVPRPTILQVWGEYYHESDVTSEDTFKVRQLKQMGYEVKIIWGKQSDTPEKAYEAVLAAVGRF